MQIVVTDYPMQPKECLFSQWNCEYGWVCSFDKRKCDIEETRCKYLLGAWKSNDVEFLEKVQGKDRYQTVDLFSDLTEEEIAEAFADADREIAEHRIIQEEGE